MKYLKAISILGICGFILILTYSTAITLSFEGFKDYLSILLTTVGDLLLCAALIVLLDKRKDIKGSKIKFSQFNIIQKIVSVFMLVIVLIPIGLFLINIISDSNHEKVILYSNLNAKDFTGIIKKLEKWNIDFIPDPDDKVIWVNPKERVNIKMKLAQEGLIPQGTKGWELFDTNKWTNTVEKKQPTIFEENIFRFLVYILLAITALIALILILLLSLLFILPGISKVLLYLELMIKKMDSIKKR